MTKVNRTKAIKAWEAGKEILIAPNKVNEFLLTGGWNLGYHFPSKERVSREVVFNTFKSNEDNFKFYNCCYGLGYYCQYWIL